MTLLLPMSLMLVLMIMFITTRTRERGRAQVANTYTNSDTEVDADTDIGTGAEDIIITIISSGECNFAKSNFQWHAMGSVATVLNTLVRQTYYLIKHDFPIKQKYGNANET